MTTIASTTPREVLADIVAIHGETLLASPLRTEGLLKDYCGEFRREIFVLVSCLRVGIVDQLLRQGGPSVKLVCARLALKLEQNLAISSDVAKWAVESWAVAARLMPPETALTQLDSIVEASARAAAQAPVPPTAPEPLAESGDAQSSEAAEPIEYIAEPPESDWPVPDWSQPTATITVYPDTAGQKPTLREAVRGAEAGALLLLQPGFYRESLVLKKNIQIQAASTGRGVILESTAGSAILVDGACVRIAWLEIKAVAGKEKASAIEIKSGHIVVEDCDLTSESASIVEVKGARSEAIMHRCHLHDGKGNGIVFADEAVGFLGACDIYQNKLSQVVIGKGCMPILSACKISHALMAGLYITEGGEGLIENCDIWGNAVGGIQCRRGGNPRLRHCRISSNDRYGVLIAEQGAGLFESCQIFDNQLVGVTISQKSNPRFTACQIFDNHGDGIDIDGESQVELLDCEIFANAAINVTVKDSSDPRLHRCVIHDGRKGGLQIGSSSEGVFEQCEFYANAQTAVLVMQGAKPNFQHCVFHDGADGGLIVTQGSEGQFVDCELTHHAGTAVLVADKSQPRFERCHIVDNSTIGFHVDDSSSPVLQDCVIAQNEGAGFLCTHGGNPRMTGGELAENGLGLEVTSQGRGRWEQVHFIANRGDSIVVSDGGRPTLRQCRIEQAEGNGLHFRSQAQGAIEDTVIVGCGGSGVEIDAGASPMLKQLSITEGQGPGVVVRREGGGTAERCAINGNAGGDWYQEEGSRLTRVGC